MKFRDAPSCLLWWQPCRLQNDEPTRAGDTLAFRITGGQVSPKYRSSSAGGNRAFRVMDHLCAIARARSSAPGSVFSSMNAVCFSDVARAEEQHAFARQTVASRAAGFLIIAFDVLRQIVMDHEADVRFVDAHPERDRRADDAHFIAQEMLLIARAFPVRVPRDTAAP